MLTTVKSAFLDHPRAVDESYMQHMIFAIRFSGRLFLAAWQRSSMPCFRSSSRRQQAE
jgi:hypothetical protein